MPQQLDYETGSRRTSPRFMVRGILIILGVSAAILAAGVLLFALFLRNADWTIRD